MKKVLNSEELEKATKATKALPVLGVLRLQRRPYSLCAVVCAVVCLLAATGLDLAHQVTSVTHVAEELPSRAAVSTKKQQDCLSSSCSPLDTAETFRPEAVSAHTGYRFSATTTDAVHVHASDIVDPMRLASPVHQLTASMVRRKLHGPATKFLKAWQGVGKFAREALTDAKQKRTRRT